MPGAHHLGDYAEFLHALDAEGFEYTVIGGCAVGAYARLRGVQVLSKDLDLYVPAASLPELTEWARSRGATIIQAPTPRTLPAAVLDWRGQRVDLLTTAPALPSPSGLASRAHRFDLSSFGGGLVLIADPFDLLANKLAVRRPSDEVHIELLTHYLEQEVRAAMASPGKARDRMRPARRLMETMNTHALSRQLAEQLLPLVNDAVTRRFLAGTVPLRDQAQRLIALAPQDERASLAQIVSRRQF